MSVDDMVIIGIMVYCAVMPIVLIAHFVYRLLYRNEDDRDI